MQQLLMQPVTQTVDEVDGQEGRSGRRHGVRRGQHGIRAALQERGDARPPGWRCHRAAGRRRAYRLTRPPPAGTRRPSAHRAARSAARRARQQQAQRAPAHAQPHPVGHDGREPADAVAPTGAGPVRPRTAVLEHQHEHGEQVQHLTAHGRPHHHGQVTIAQHRRQQTAGQRRDGQPDALDRVGGRQPGPAARRPARADGPRRRTTPAAARSRAPGRPRRPPPAATHIATSVATSISAKNVRCATEDASNTVRRPIESASPPVGSSSSAVVSP